MSNFQGYLFKATDSNQIFPMKYIAYNTWKSTPNQREEIKAYRDDNTRNLTRVTASGTKSVFQFDTRDTITLDEKMEIQAFFTDNESVALERKINITYWNDEENAYKTGAFYRPDIVFQIKHIEGNNIIYSKATIKLIEY
mgnify:CR=1 FL=1